MNLHQTIASVLVLVAGACAPGPVPISRSSTDPSSPTAPEGKSPLVAHAAPVGEPVHVHEHVHDPTATDGGSEGATYVCPMHPEVTSSTPGGVCPKCNMKLVPRRP